MYSQESSASRAFAYEAKSEHAKALTIWKRNKSKRIYPGAFVRAAEIARFLRHKHELIRLLNLIEPKEVIEEFGVELGEALIIELVKSRNFREFDKPTTIKIDAARWESGAPIEKLTSCNFHEYALRDLPSRSCSLLEVEHPLNLKDKIFRKSRNRSFFRTRHETFSIDLNRTVAIIGSNAFVSDDFMYVDEFRSTYPQIASCDDDPLVLGIKDGKALSIKLRPKERLVGGFWLAIKYGNEFGHFISTLLTRVKYFESHPKWGTWPLIVSDELTKVQLEYLQTIFPGIPISSHPHSESMYFDTLVVAPTAVFSPATIHCYSKEPDWVFLDLEEFAWLYEKMRAVELNSNNKFKKIAITRRVYGRRKCLNATKWENLARSNGFEIVDPADLSAIEQIGLFCFASDIVGEVGSWIYLSGLNPSSNLTLLNNDADYQVWSEISQLNKLRKFPIKVVIGKREGSKMALTDPSNVHASWVLTTRNIREIRRIFQNIRSKSVMLVP